MSGQVQGKNIHPINAIKNSLKTDTYKGEYSFPGMIQLFLSNIAALVFLILFLILPKKVIKAMGNNWLGYWYRQRRKDSITWLIIQFINKFPVGMNETHILIKIQCFFSVFTGGHFELNHIF